MASLEAWKYSQKLFGKLSLIFNSVSLVLSVFVMILNWGILFEWISNMSATLFLALLVMWTAQTIILCFAVPFVESKLMKKFPEKPTL